MPFAGWCRYLYLFAGGTFDHGFEDAHVQVAQDFIFLGDRLETALTGRAFIASLEIDGKNLKKKRQILSKRNNLPLAQAVVREEGKRFI